MIKKNQIVGISPPFHSFQKNKQSRQILFAEPSQAETSLHQHPIESDIFLQAMEAKSHLSKQAIGIVNSIKEFLDQNPLSEKTTFDFAQEANVDRRDLQRWFKQSVGIGIKEYSNQQRLAFAKQLLEEGDKSIKQIAVICHYSSQAYFSTVFKKKYGITPVEWKRQNS